MSVEVENDADHDINNSGSSIENESKIRSETLVMDLVGAQQPRDARPKLKGHSDENFLHVIAKALQQVIGSTPSTISTSITW